MLTKLKLNSGVDSGLLWPAYEHYRELLLEVASEAESYGLNARPLVRLAVVELTVTDRLSAIRDAIELLDEIKIAAVMPRSKAIDGSADGNTAEDRRSGRPPDQLDHTSGSGQADNKADNQKKLVPDNPRILRLCESLRTKLGTADYPSQIGVAIEFTDGDESQEKTLLRQTRRYRHLWKADN